MIQLFELSEQELLILSFLNTVILNKSRQEYPDIKVMMDRLGIDKVTLTESILELKIRGYIRQVGINGEEPFWSNLDAVYKISDEVKKDVTEWLVFDETRAKVEINKDYMWYAVYGSSVCFEKFIHHIEGGIFPFNHTQYVGCTDITHPIASRKITIPYRGYIGGSSALWQYSGTMFLDYTQIGETLGRMYLIKKDQYEEIRDALGRGNTGYNKEIKLGEYLGNEIKTVTTKENRIPSEPSKKYKQVVKQGLMELYGKGDKEMVINYINRVFNKEVKLNLNTDCIRNEYYQDIRKALKLICPLSSRQVKYLKQGGEKRSHSFVWSFFYAHHFSLYLAIRLFCGIGYCIGVSVFNASVLTSNGVLQL